MRQKKVVKKTIQEEIGRKLLPYFAEIRHKLKAAKMTISPEFFLGNCVMKALRDSVLLSIAFAVILYALEIPLIIVPLLFIISLVFLFFSNLYLPDREIIRMRKEIERDLVFAFKHMLISLRAGMPLFDALFSISEGYGELSREIKEIVMKVEGGSPLSQVLKEKAQETPSRRLSNLLFQIDNALLTGADLASTLEKILDQMEREQLLELKAYGQKLNPLIMFFMMFGIVFPILGITIAVVFLTLFGGGITVTFNVLTVLAFAIFGIQVLFLAVISSIRPIYFG